MSEREVEVVGRALEGWATGDFGAGLEALDAHVTFVVRPPFPEPGVVIGPEGISGYMRRFLEQWEGLTVAAKRIRAAGDTVMAEVAMHGSGTASGVEVDMRYFMLFTFRGGRILHIESILDEDDALETLGLSAPFR